MTVTQWPCVFFITNSTTGIRVVHMTTVEAAAPRRADIVCVERPDVDAGAAQMLLEYQDARACNPHVHARTHAQKHYKAVAAQLLRLMFLSVIIRLTLKLFFCSLPTLCQFLAGLTNSDGDTVADCGWGHWPQGCCACLRW